LDLKGEICAFGLNGKEERLLVRRVLQEPVRLLSPVVVVEMVEIAEVAAAVVEKTT
jgi:hypothetical protein